jgi:hypothetical protein
MPRAGADSPRRRRGRILLAALASLFCGVPAGAQDAREPNGRPVVRAAGLPDGTPITIDGILDEPAWTLAGAATGFRQRDPDNGAEATERTEVRILFDADRLLLGVTCFDSEPDRLLGNQMQRDQDFDADDRFMWSLDPYLDGRTGYFFEINPSGAMGDGLITSPVGGDGGGFGGEMNKSWDGIWLARVRRTAAGWSAEIEIPFKTLNFTPGSETWGVNFQRTVRRRNEESLWTGWLRDEGLTKMSNAGRLEGLSGITQGVGLDIKPYVLGAVGSAPGRNQPATTGDGDVGVDLFYNVTPSLKSNFTVNTDFAETEVDDRRVNLTRFPLFYEEKRVFFLDGANFFDFPSQGVTPFFSRRIGLNEGLPQPIWYGAKLIGQAGLQDIGVLQVSTGEDADRGLPGEDFTVARVKRRLGTQSHVGGLFTRRDPRGSPVEPGYTAGADVIIATPSFLGDKVLESGAWFVHTSRPEGVVGGGNAYGWGFELAKDPWDAGINFEEVQEAYDAQVGFAPRDNVRSWDMRAGIEPRLDDHPWIRGFEFDANAEIFTNLDNVLVNREVQATPLAVEFHSGDSVEFQLFRMTEHLDEDFEIEDGIILPQGSRYAWTRYQVSTDTAEQRPLSAQVEYSWGGFWDGDRKEISVSLALRPRAGVFLQIETEYNDVDLAGGSFITRLFQFDARTQFNPWVSLTSNLQYDTESRVLGWQTRFRWILRPGNDIYFVYTQNWREDDLLGYQTLDQRAVAKAIYTWRF